MKIILDTDFGDDIDDTFALYYLLKQAGDKISLILSSFGQTTKRAELICEFLERIGRKDIPVGVGVENKNFRDPYTYRFKEKESAFGYPIIKNGVEKARELIETNDDVVIIAIAPMTNLFALSEICPKAKNVPVYAMFGSVYKGYFGSDTPDREYNVFADVVASQNILTFYKNLTVAPLDTCGIIRFEGDSYGKFLKSKNPVAEYYKKWLTLSFHKEENKSSVLYDTQPVYMLTDGEMLEYEELSLKCDDKGNLSVADGENTVKCALRWKNFDGYIKMLEKIFTD